MLPFAGYLRRQLGMIAPRVALVCAGSFLAGIVALICACFVVPQHTHDVLRIRRLHELLGRSAAGFLALAMICGCWCAWKGRHKSRGASRLFWIWSALTLLPLAGIFCSEALLLLTRLEPTRMQPVHAALRHSIFWHLGFWEWTGAVSGLRLSLCGSFSVACRKQALKVKGWLQGSPFAFARDDRKGITAPSIPQ